MSIFTKLLGRKLNEAQTEALLGEIEQLSALQCVFPAMVRLRMLGEKASREIIGPNGPLHDRFYRVGLELAREVGSRPSEMVRITSAWDALPNVLHASIGFCPDSLSVTFDHLVHALIDKRKEFVVFSNAIPGVREQDPERQMRAFFDLADNPSWSLVLLTFSGSLVVRADVIRKYSSTLRGATIEELFTKLCSASDNEGAVKVLR